MSETTLTFEIGGRVEMRDLREGISLFVDLVAALSPSRGVSWVVEDMRAGSAITTLRGEADDTAVLERIVADYEKIGLELSQNQDPSHVRLAARSASRDILALAGRVDYVKFKTPTQNYMVFGNGTEVEDAPTSPLVSIGAITGRVQTVSNRSGLIFNLYDDVLDRRVTCYLEPGQKEMMREAWDRRVSVSGSISRNSATGAPTSIRDISKVDILEDPVPGAYRNARGAVPWKSGDMLPEEVIRLSRDA